MKLPGLTVILGGLFPSSGLITVAAPPIKYGASLLRRTGLTAICSGVAKRAFISAGSSMASVKTCRALEFVKVFNASLAVADAVAAVEILGVGIG